MFGQKLLWTKNNSYQKYVGLKIFVRRKFVSEKICVQKPCVWKLLCQKKLWLPKDFWFQKMFGLRIKGIGSEFLFGQKKTKV